MGIHDGHREKLRRRFLDGGLDTFADHEALELLLFYAIPRRDTNELAHRLMEHYGTLDAVLTAPLEELTQISGIGENAAALIRLVPRLAQKARLLLVFSTNRTVKSLLLILLGGGKLTPILMLAQGRLTTGCALEARGGFLIALLKNTPSRATARSLRQALKCQ
jgi:hypothetical protein